MKKYAKKFLRGLNKSQGGIIMSRRGENIRKRKDGRWEGRYSYTLNGKKITKSVYARSYLESKKKLAEAKSNIELSITNNLHHINSKLH